MSRLVVAALALSALGYLAYRAMYSVHAQASEDIPKDLAEREASAPRQQLDNVRAKAKDIEARDQAYARDIEEKTESP